MPKSFVLLMASLVVMAAMIPAPAAAESDDGTAVIPAGGHLVLLNFPVTGDRWEDPSNAGNVRYLVYLDEGSLQEHFDVYVMTASTYQQYISGGPLQLAAGWGSDYAGEVPAFNLVYLFYEDDYVLLIDNTDVGFGPYAPAELKVHYEYEAQNVDVYHETRWDVFIALMVLVALLGLVFLLLLNIWAKHRLARADAERGERCSNCGKVSVTEGEFCPYCGKER